MGVKKTKKNLFFQVDTIPLSRPRRNLARDFSDAVLAAEVAGFLWPEEKLFGCGSGGGAGGNGGNAVPAFQPANSTAGKIYNWCVFRERVLRRLRIPATRADVEAAARGEPGAAEWILALLRQRAERGGGGAGARREQAGAAATPPPTRVVRRKGGGGADLVSSHSYAPSPLVETRSNSNCRGGWRAAALAARVGCGGGGETPRATTAGAAAAKTKARTSSRREQPPPPQLAAAAASEQRRTRLLFPSSPAAAPLSAKRATTAAAAAAAATEARPAPSSLFSPSLPPLERENAALRGQVARLERLVLRQEAQIEALLEALEDASATAAAAAAATAAAAASAPASAAPSPAAAAAAENEEDDGPPPPQQQKILSSGMLKLPGGGGVSGSSFPSSSPLRALEGAVLIGRC